MLLSGLLGTHSPPPAVLSSSGISIWWLLPPLLKVSQRRGRGRDNTTCNLGFLWEELRFSHPLQLPHTSADEAITANATAKGSPGSLARVVKAGQGLQARLPCSTGTSVSTGLPCAPQLGHWFGKIRGTDAGWRQSPASLPAQVESGEIADPPSLGSPHRSICHL